MTDGDRRPSGASDEWMGLRRRREVLGRAASGEPIEAEVIEAPASSWGADHRVRLLRTAGAKGLVPTMAVERVDGTLQAYQLPARGERLSDLADQTRFTRWRERAAVVEASARAVHEGHLLGLHHGALSEDEIHIAGRRLAVAGMGLTRGARLPDDPAIVAPEVRAGAAPTPRSDVFSLGMVLDRGVAADRGALPAAVAAEIEIATSPDPARRHPTTLALADAIRSAGGPSLPTYELAALGSSDRGRAFAAALAGGVAGAGGAAAAGGVAGAGGAAAAGAPAGDATADDAGGAVGRSGEDASPTPGSAASGAAGAAETTTPAGPGRRGALLAAAALVAVAGLGLWASSGNDSVDEASVSSTTTAPSTTARATTTAPSTTAPATTVAPTTAPATTVAPTTAPATTVAPTTAPATTAPPTTAPATTAPSTVVASAEAQMATDAAMGYEILHALPDSVVDVYLDGELSAAGFAPGMLAGPLLFADDVSSLSLFPTMDDPPILAAARADESLLDVPLDQDRPGTLVITLDGEQPVAEFFTDDLSPVPAGQGRLTLVPVGDTVGSPTIDGVALTSPPEPVLLPAGPHEVVVSSPSGDVVFSATVDVPEGALTTGFIRPTGGVGAPGSGNEPVALAIRRVTGLVSAPTGIPSGDGGLLGERGTDGLGPALVMMTLLGLAGLVVQRRRVLRPDER